MVIAGLLLNTVLALETAACTSAGRIVSDVPAGKVGPATTVKPSTKDCEVCWVRKLSWEEIWPPLWIGTFRGWETVHDTEPVGRVPHPMVPCGKVMEIVPGVLCKPSSDTAGGFNKGTTRGGGGSLTLFSAGSKACESEVHIFDSASTGERET